VVVTTVTTAPDRASPKARVPMARVAPPVLTAGGKDGVTITSFNRTSARGVV
jgi:hypothetical protein